MSGLMDGDRPSSEEDQVGSECSSLDALLAHRPKQSGERVSSSCSVRSGHIREDKISSSLPDTGEEDREIVSRLR